LVSTVTTTTVTTVTTATIGIIAELSLVAIVTLLGLLIAKEVVSGSDRRLAKAFGRALNVAVVPLLMGFVLIAAVRVLEVLR
jgi:hypothetical protein